MLDLLHCCCTGFLTRPYATHVAGFGGSPDPRRGDKNGPEPPSVKRSRVTPPAILVYLPPVFQNLSSFPPSLPTKTPHSRPRQSASPRRPLLRSSLSLLPRIRPPRFAGGEMAIDHATPLGLKSRGAMVIDRLVVVVVQLLCFLVLDWFQWRCWIECVLMACDRRAAAASATTARRTSGGRRG